MHFLIDEDLPREVSNLLQSYGHKAIDIRDTELKGAKDFQIAYYAQKESLCLLTGDYDFSDIRNYPPAQYAGLVVLNIPKNSTAKYIVNLLEEFLKHENLISELPGKLAIVEPGRIRIKKA